MTNRLSSESSPYLLQHQNNPVDWYPWGAEALEKARAESKPILLSIGYSACHWCHVMEHESFENESIAQLMNKNFISIKVDREERPDLDQIYQNVAQIMTQGGGWPLTVFLTPDLKPFFGGTYFPPEDRYGRPGFARVLQALADAYQNDRLNVVENAEKLTEMIRSLEFGEGTAVSSTQPNIHDLRKAVDELLSRVDGENGGFGHQLKFPNPMLLSFLWRMGNQEQALESQQSEQARQAVRKALTRMASGGIYDQLGGGFHRYSVDASWSVPHFEKMLYDNALLLKLYAEVLLTPALPKQREGDEKEQSEKSKKEQSENEALISVSERSLYINVLLETTQYLYREMLSPQGGFYSAQDADSEGEEGKFFAWDLEDLSRELTMEEAQAFALRYGVTDTGNFEHGKTVLYQAQSILDVARKCGLTEEKASDILSSARAKLFAVRSRRIAPALDNKILTSWNGLTISGLLWASQALRQAGRLEEASRAQLTALQAFEFLCQKVQIEGRLLSSVQRNQGKGNGFLDDYAFMAMAALDLARFSGAESPLKGEGPRYLKLCQSWVDSILKHFKESGSSGYFFTSDDHEALLQRPKTLFDQAIPSGTAVALTCMSALASMDELNRNEVEVFEQLSRLFEFAVKQPFGMGELLCSSLLFLSGPITASGGEAQSLCVHPHVFQNFDDSPEASQRGILVCHHKTCSLPLQGADEAHKAVSSLICRSLARP